MAFADRTEAGRLLARVVARHFAAPPGATAPTAHRPLVLALPRGGVPVAIPIAHAIDGDLDVVIVRKIGAPGQPELGVGALAEDGPPLVDRAAMAHLHLTDADIAPVVAGERTELARRTRRYRGDRPAPAVDGRTVVLVDDGLATGVTALAAVGWIRSRNPARLIVATPVCSRPARQALVTKADAVLCLHVPRRFRAVGAWYDDFSQLTDDDVIRGLAERKAG
jgi:putative phosphoribosyl transferase